MPTDAGRALRPLSQATAMPRISPRDLRLAQQLVHAPAQSMHIYGQAWRLRWRPDPLCAPVAWLHLRIGGARMAVGFESLTGLRNWSSLVDAKAPDSLVAACVEMMGKPVWQAIAEHTGSAVDVLGFEGAAHEAPAAVSRVGLQLEQADGPLRIRAVACLQDKAALALAVSMAPTLTRTMSPVAASHDADLTLDALPIQLAAELGRTRLPIGELTDLAPGDAVLVERLKRRGTTALRLCGGASAATLGECMFNELGLEIVAIDEPRGEKPMTDESLMQPEAAHVSQAIEQMQVELRFELARWRTTIGELRRMQPGSVVELSRPVDGENVTLWVEHRCVGRGRVVMVGDELAVQVLERPAAPADSVRHGTD